MSHIYDSLSILGIKTAIEQNPSIVYKGKDNQKSKKTNEPLDGINEEGSYTNSGFDDGTETYNNSTVGYNNSIGTYNNSTIGYNNSNIGYNNTQPSMGYSNDNEDIETGRGGRSARYLPHN